MKLKRTADKAALAIEAGISGGPLTSDLFYRGAFEALQPATSGLRSGSDALLLAASLPADAQGSLAELGAGTGVAGLAALVANPKLNALLVEIDPFLAQIAEKNLTLATNAAISRRAEVLRADVTLAGRDREKAGLSSNVFDFVIMNPPYNDRKYRAPPDPRKARALVMDTGNLDKWMRTAAAILRAGGWLHLIYRAEGLGEIIPSAHGRFGDLSILPLHSRSNKPASRIIVRARAGSRGRLTILPGVVLHDENNAPTEIATAALNGKARLFSDPPAQVL